MKIIFLDYDGVVNTIWFQNPKEKPNFNFPRMLRVNNTQAIGWLNQLYEKYPYSLVITSTWRFRSDYKECLYNAGLNPEIPILGRTPSLLHTNNYRGKEIQAWIKSFDRKDEIEDFVILDDDTDMKPFLSHLIVTHTWVGFSLVEYTEIVNRWDRIANSFIKKIKIKRQERIYAKYIENHRRNVREAYNDVLQCPTVQRICTPHIYELLFARVLNHDLSKYSYEEFDAYRRYYHPIAKYEKAEALTDFKKAWEHHLANNDHHWQHRQYDNNEELSDNTIAAVLENVCDWIAMGKHFHNTAYEYYEKNKNKIILPSKQKQLLEQVLIDLENNNVSKTRKELV